MYLFTNRFIYCSARNMDRQRAAETLKQERRHVSSSGNRFIFTNSFSTIVIKKWSVNKLRLLWSSNVGRSSLKSMAVCLLKALSHIVMETMSANDLLMPWSTSAGRSPNKGNICTSANVSFSTIVVETLSAKKLPVI